MAPLQLPAHLLRRLHAMCEAEVTPPEQLLGRLLDGYTPRRVAFRERLAERLQTEVVALQKIDAGSERDAEEMQSLLTELRDLVKQAGLPEELHAYGSAATPMAGMGSDVDITWCVPLALPEGHDVEAVPEEDQLRIEAFNQLKILQDIVEGKLTGVARTELIKARHPVLKLRAFGGGEIGDLSVSNIEGLRNTAFIRLCCHSDPRFVTVARTIKHWAKARRMADRRFGGIAPYTLQMMVAEHFRHEALLEGSALQAAAAALRASETPDEVAKAEEEGLSQVIAAKPSQEDPASAGELLLRFFERYGDSARGEGMVVKPCEGISASEQETLEVFCPVSELDVNPMPAPRWRKHHKEFEQARSLLLAACGKDEEDFALELRRGVLRLICTMPEPRGVQVTTT